jgi:hypothetical protein
MNSLKRIESKTIPWGSILIVESPDRASRQRFSEAYPTYQRILSAGIEIHFLSIRDVLKPEHSFTNILRVGVEIDRANCESVLKSERVGEAWSKKPGTSFSQSAHRDRESDDSSRLPSDGICPRPGRFHARRCRGRNRVDVVCVRTLGCSPARDAKLVKRPYERDRHHGFPRCDGFGRRRLGSGCSCLGIASYLDRGRHPVVDQFDSGDSFVD